jgi:hypothetical protein
MSNFLQRVAASVIQPKARLQPMFGSIFAPATLSSPAEFSPAQGEISSQTLAPHREEPRTAPHFDTSSQAFASQVFTNVDGLFSAAAQEDSSPSRSNRRQAADQPLLPSFGAPTDIREPTHTHSSLEDSPFESSKPAAANRPTPPGPYQPLVAAGHQTAPKLQPRDAMPTAAAIRTAGSEAARLAQPAQREADEIHIHIGRIEVAAISQPSLRPEAAAARRSLNLDEYLRRGNGQRG